jgi:hypothetical protein
MLMRPHLGFLLSTTLLRFFAKNRSDSLFQIHAVSPTEQDPPLLLSRKASREMETSDALLIE